MCWQAAANQAEAATTVAQHARYESGSLLFYSVACGRQHHCLLVTANLEVAKIMLFSEVDAFAKAE